MGTSNLVQLYEQMVFVKHHPTSLLGRIIIPRIQGGDIPVIVKVTLLAERMGHGTDVIPDIKEVVDVFKGGLFDTKNISNPVYGNSKGAAIGSCLRVENPATGIVEGLKGFEDVAHATQRPASIFFVTVLTMIYSAGKKIQFYQSFSLPQIDTDHLRNGAAHKTRGCGG